MNLRIMLGCYRNRAIKLPAIGVRPTLARARRIIFDTIEFWRGKSYSFLDSFAGSGIMGIEALSRGAEKVVFFDQDIRVIKNLKLNLANMPAIGGAYHIIKTNTLHPPKGTPVDIVFIDAPYISKGLWVDVIKKLIKYNWINQESWIIVEIEAKSYKDETIDDFYLFKTSKVSKSLLLFFQSTKMLNKDIDSTKDIAKSEICFA